MGNTELYTSLRPNCGQHRYVGSTATTPIGANLSIIGTEKG
jgi:hypothetical protein